MKKSVLAILIFCMAASAQTPLGLRYPLGIPLAPVTGTSAAMGGSGTAVIDEYMGTGLNPANAAIGDRAAFSALVAFDYTRVSDSDGSSSTRGYTPSLVSLILPIGSAGNIALSMEKRYEAGLNFQTTDVLKNKDYTLTNTVQFQRKGGLTAWQAVWGHRFDNNLSLGFAYERLYFNSISTVNDKSEIRYDLESGSMPFKAHSTENEETGFASNGIRFGMQVPVHKKVMFGAAFEYIVTGSGSATRKYWPPDVDEKAPDSTTEDVTVSLPPAINIGVTYALNDRVLLAADAFSTLWERYENDFVQTGAVSTYGISAGARYIPAAGRLVSTYPEKIHYSAGLRYTTLPIDKKHKNGAAHEYELTAGAGLPIPGDGGLIDIVLGAGQRTDARYSGYAERFVQFKLGINGGRSWFQKDASRDY